MVQGGVRINNVPSKALAKIDIRMPPGATVDDVTSRIAELLGEMPHIAWRVLDAAEPNWTAPDAAIVSALLRNAETVLGDAIGVSIRPGFSDSRFFGNETCRRSFMVSRRKTATRPMSTC